MKRLIMVGVVGLFVVATGFGVLGSVYSAGYGQSGKTSKYDIGDATETLTLPSGVATGFTAGKLSTVNGDKTVRAVVQVEGADIRVTWDGTTATSSIGLKITDGSWFQVIGEDNITNFSAYATTGTATAYVMYEKESEMNKSGF